MYPVVKKIKGTRKVNDLYLYYFFFYFIKQRVNDVSH